MLPSPRRLRRRLPRSKLAAVSPLVRRGFVLGPFLFLVYAAASKGLNVFNFLHASVVRLRFRFSADSSETAVLQRPEDSWEQEMTPLQE